MKNLTERERISDFLKNEKEISKYKIKTLNKIRDLKPSRRRTLEIEEEFVLFPFEHMGFSSLSDAMTAVEIYRQSRGLFYKTYSKEVACIKEREIELYRDSICELTELLNKKLEFLRKTIVDWVSVRVQEINLVQDEGLFDDLVRYQVKRSGSEAEVRKSLSGLNIDELIKVEPSIISKRRARMQACVLSSGLYLDEELRHLDELIKNESAFIGDVTHVSNAPGRDNYLILKKYNDHIDNIFMNWKHNIFVNYNKSIGKLQSIVNNNMGHNDYASKIYELDNILSYEFENEAPIIANGDSSDGWEYTPSIGNIANYKKAIYEGVQRDCAANIKNKIYGILLPVTHKGNERMTLLGLKIISNTGIDISNLFSKKLSNVRANPGASLSSETAYYKALMIHQPWKLIIDIDSYGTSKGTIKELLGIDPVITDTNSAEVIDKVNSHYCGFTPIGEDSFALSPKTRSEDEAIAKIIPNIHRRINQVVSDYLAIKSPTNETAII